MSVRSGSYLIALVLTLAGACGAESPVGVDENEADETDDDGDDVEPGDDDDDEPVDTGDDEDDEPTDPPSRPAPRDAATPRLDAGTSTPPVLRDAATPRTDASATPPRSDAGASQSDSGSGSTGSDAGSGSTEKGECCDDGDCLCHGPVPNAPTSSRGPFKTAELRIAAGTVTYPTDAEPPFAGVAVCGGFLNTGPEMATWAPFYASHGIVTVITSTGAADTPDIRARKLLDAIEQLKAENTKSGSPLNGKMSGRYGTSGYSMGGGGTTIAASGTPSLKTSIGLAPWGGSGSRTTVATLLLCGSADTTAPCSMAQSVYRGIPEMTPKMMINISGVSHFGWFGPTDAGRGTSGAYALAFQKVYLEGDTRWKPLLLQKPSGATATTNIQ